MSNARLEANDELLPRDPDWTTQHAFYASAPVGCLFSVRKSRQHDALNWIFSKLTSTMHYGTKINGSHFAVKKLKFKVTLIGV